VSATAIIFGFLTVIIASSAFILSTWMKFADKQINKRNTDLNQKEFIKALSSQIKTINKNFITNKFKNNSSNVIIDVECEIVEESNSQTKYLYLDN
jgi:hypothetical protein